MTRIHQEKGEINTDDRQKGRGGLEKVGERKQERLRAEKYNRGKEEEAMKEDSGTYN